VTSCDVSPELARQNALAGQRAPVVVHSGGEIKQYTVRKQDSDDSDAIVSCDGSSEVTPQTTTAMGYSDKLLEKR
jgi:pilus assembly protein CpaB